MSNSALISKEVLSPNFSNRTQPISKITFHHAAGVLSATKLAGIFTPVARQASANYCIGNDGEIVLCVPEDKRAWTSSSAWNDQRAITVEVSNSKTGGDWLISDAALASCIKLAIDICQRNNIKSLEYTGDKNGSLTTHRMFAATACPGPYLLSKLPYIAEQVNAALNPAPQPAAPAAPTKLSAAEIAEGMKRGDYGNGAARKKKLKELGYTDAEIQAAQDIVNGNKAAEPAKPAKLTAEQLADEIIAAKWGNGDARIANLKAAGYTDAEITAAQSVVNNKLAKKPAAPAAPAATYYTVRKNDNLSTIAKRYGTTVNKIMALNKGLIKNANLIRVGWKIRIK